MHLLISVPRVVSYPDPPTHARIADSAVPRSNRLLSVELGASEGAVGELRVTAELTAPLPGCVMVADGTMEHQHAGMGHSDMDHSDMGHSAIV